MRRVMSVMTGFTGMTLAACATAQTPRPVVPVVPPPPTAQMPAESTYYGSPAPVYVDSGYGSAPVYNSGPIYNSGPVYSSNAYTPPPAPYTNPAPVYPVSSAPVYADQVPYSSAAYSSAPPPTVTPAVQAFRDPGQADAEQRRTAQLLAAQQRDTSRSMRMDYPASNLSPLAQPTRMVASSSVPPPAAPVSYSTATTTPAVYGVSSNQLVTEPGSTNPDYYGAAIPPMPSARPGECFALVRRPEQYRLLEKQFVAKPGYDRLEVMPARFEASAQDIVVQDTHERLEVVPATFRTVTEQVEVRPPSTRYVTTEPVYDTVTEQIMERPGRQVWKRGRGPIERMDNATGEIMCLVEEPPVFKTVTRRVLRTPPQAREVAIPGEYRTVTRRVLERPAEVRRVPIAEQRTRIPVQRLAEPARVNQIRVPDEIGTTTIKELATPATLEWRPVLCETNMTPDVVGRVQDALRREGFNPGPSDGRLGGSTIAALNAYQRSRGLPVDTYLNMETMRSLGLY